jgi:DNA-binding GntR family transcriptional regulator
MRSLVSIMGALRDSGWRGMAERGTYGRIADELGRQIEAGEFAPGSMLPSEASLAGRFEVARGTIRAALSVLEGEGRIEVVPGRGRRVAGDGAAAPTAAYEVIADSIRTRVESGDFAQGVPLPSEAALMSEFDASRNTVRRAYELLEREGIVVIRQGAGAFLAGR